MYTPNNVPAPRSALMRFLVRSREYRHLQAWVRVRVACGVFNLGLGVLLLAWTPGLAGSAAAGRGGADLLDRLSPADQCPELT